jgi:catechol 2,3-dioxygenase-like lactoylglutathione lyase family enzyme
MSNHNVPAREKILGTAFRLFHKQGYNSTGINQIIKESNVTINVKDLVKSVSFYEVIGFTLKNRWGNYYAQLTAPGLVIGLHPTSDNNLADNSGNVSFGFTTDSFEETKDSLQQLSIPATERQEEGGQLPCLAARAKRCGRFPAREPWRCEWTRP